MVNEDKNYVDLFFENSQGDRRLLFSNIKKEEVFKRIRTFCDDRNFKIYYVRVTDFENGETQYDVGSHSEFFWAVQTNFFKKE